MADLRTVWAEVGTAADRLGLKVKLHVQEELSEGDGGSPWERMGSTLEELLEGLGDAYRDPAVRSDVADVASSLGAALQATVEEARRQIPGGGR